jgi:hypothetical protein
MNDLDHIIPPITDKMGRSWDQPDRHEIEIDGSYARMSLKTFEALKDYSWTMPTGVYPGKMWRAFNSDLNTWWLRWYGEHEDPKLCRNHQREIIVEWTFSNPKEIKP